MNYLALSFLINIVIIAMAVLVHYEMFNKLSVVLPSLKIKHRYRLLVGVFGALLAHVIAVWIFAFAYYFLMKSGNFGMIEIFGAEPGAFQNTILNCVYFSFVTYTSLGYGDLVPVGLLGNLAGLEALTGLVLIAWTASFLYFQMQANWPADKQ